MVIDHKIPEFYQIKQKKWNPTADILHFFLNCKHIPGFHSALGPQDAFFPHQDCRTYLE